MTYPIKVEAHGLVLSMPSRERIESLASDLATYYPRLVSCAVRVEGPGGHHRHGDHQVRIRLEVPTRTLVINHRRRGTLEEAIADSFKAAGRRLQDHARRIRGDVKRRARTA